MNNELFKSVGFSDTQAEIYLTLLREPLASISQLAKQTGYNRAKIYAELPGLIDSGSVHMVERGRQKRYQACDPEVLKRQHLAQSEEFVEGLTELAKQLRGANMAGVRVLDGAEGLREVMEDVLATLGREDTLYRYSSRDPKMDVRAFMPKDFSARRAAKGFDQYTITNHALKTSKYKNQMNRVSKGVPPEEDAFEYNISLLIYGPKVALVDFTLRQAVIMNNQALAAFHKRLFLMLYHRI